MLVVCLSSIEAEAAAVKKGGWDRQRPAGSSAGCHTPDKLPVEETISSAEIENVTFPVAAVEAT